MDSVEFRFCAQCLDDIQHLSKVTAFCKQCNEYICSDLCLRQHGKFRLTRSHCYVLDGELKEYIEKMKMGEKRVDTDDAVTDKSKTETAAKHKNVVLRTEYNIRTEKDKEICSIHATAVLKNGCIALADLKNRNLKLFHPEQRRCTSVLKLEKGPRDICVSNVNETDLYVIESGVKGVHLVTTDHLRISKTIPTEGESHGVTCWKRGLAVTTTSKKTYYGTYELHLLDYHGRINRKFIAGKTKALEFNLPWYLTSNLNGQNVIISDFGAHSVTCVDVDGGVLFVYKDTDLIRPVSIATDNDNDIFVVSQRSHNIHHLTQKGEKEGLIYIENTMEFPGGISFDKANERFYVQCIGWSDTLQVFDLFSQRN